MYRVHGNDGNSYEAPSLATLQQWVTEGRIIPTTVVEDLLSGTEGPASGIAGLRFDGPEAFAVPLEGTDYPRQSESVVGCTVHLPLLLAIASAIFCAPVGVVAVIYAAKIPEIMARGDLERARRYAKIANRISLLAFIAAILWTMFCVKYMNMFKLPVD